MEDCQIVALYWAREQTAIQATEEKYGRYCRSIIGRILRSDQDRAECVNDVYLGAWNSMPPHRPESLRLFLGKIARRAALHRYEKLTAEKRGLGQVPAALEELAECLPGPEDTEQVFEGMALTELINAFLGDFPSQQRKIFVQRYWYLRSIREIARAYGMGESGVKMSLLRARRELKKRLEREGIL